MYFVGLVVHAFVRMLYWAEFFTYGHGHELLLQVVLVGHGIWVKKRVIQESFRILSILCFRDPHYSRSCPFCAFAILAETL